MIRGSRWEQRVRRAGTFPQEVYSPVEKKDHQKQKLKNRVRLMHPGLSKYIASAVASGRAMERGELEEAFQGCQGFYEVTKGDNGKAYVCSQRSGEGIENFVS